MPAKKKKRAVPPPAPVRTRPERASTARSGPAKKQQERAEREALQRRLALRRRLVTAGLLAVLALVVGGVLLHDRQQDAALREALTSGTCQVDTESDQTRPAGQNHVASPSYSVDPPAGGDHSPVAARAGVYRGGSVPQDGLLVHALEHGYVVLWHAPALGDEQRGQLADLERAHDGDVIVAERPSLPVPVAATAWGHRLLCQTVEPAALERFVDEHVGNGPEDVERG